MMPMFCPYCGETATEIADPGFFRCPYCGCEFWVTGVPSESNIAKDGEINRISKQFKHS